MSVYERVRGAVERGERAVVFTVLNAALLRVRIAAEDAALRELVRA